VYSNLAWLVTVVFVTVLCRLDSDRKRLVKVGKDVEGKHCQAADLLT
jgi:hypothetical protein